MIDPNAPKPPRELGFESSFKPQGYYCTFKEWPIYPNSSNQYWGVNDVVRFYNTIDTGVFDAYRSSIRFKVQVTPQTQPVGQLQVDTLATSYFSQLVISSKNVEIERIAEYDTMCAMLSDIGTSEVIAEGRSFEGMGYTNQTSNSNLTASTSVAGQNIISTSDGPYYENTIQSTIFPTRAGSGVGTKSVGKLIDGTLNCNNYITSGQSTSNVSLSNYLWAGLGPGAAEGSSLANIREYWGRFNNVRAEYNNALQNPTYPDSNTSYIQSNPKFPEQTWTVANMMGNSSTSGFNPQAPLYTNTPATTAVEYKFPGSAQTNLIDIANTPTLQGYTKFYSPETSKGGNEATISATVPTCQMYQGQITTQKFAVSEKCFEVPLFSSTIGCLIPPDQFLLIQMKSMKDLLVELTLSQYAMFTSGYCDVHEFDQVGMGTQQKRNWMITEICWNLHLYTFGESSINEALNASLVRGIPITSSFYFLGNTFQIPNGSVVRNMWPISCQSESLSEIYCVFLSNEYQKYSFCRKQFRLSNNITSMQVRLKTEFYPSQPILGNAGNPEYYNGQPDNSAFLKQLYWSNNYVFNMNVPMPRINKINFAINGRCYNTANTNTLYQSSMLNNLNYSWTPSSVNLDTAMGMPSLHENRYIGKAIYSWTWDPYGHSSEYMTGINTNGNQNFGIEFTTSSTNPFPTDETLVIFCRSNGIVIYGIDGIKVLGR